MKISKYLLFPAVLALTFAHASDIRSSDSLIRAMHDRYASSWYQSLSFTQKSTTYKPDGTTKVETWYESALLPGKLRVDVGPPADGNGFMVTDGTLTVFRGGKLAASRPLVNLLLVLGFDVYCQPADATISTIKSENFDLSKFHEDTWEGHPVYVVGAEKGDLTSKQFWIEKDRLLFVRLFEPTQADSKKIQDIRFEDYRELAGTWVSPKVEVYLEGSKVFSEEYSDIQANPKLDPARFDPTKLAAPEPQKP